MSIFTKENKPELWYRPLSRHAIDLRVLSPIDDERGSMEDALHRGDAARVQYLKTSLPAAVAEMDEELTQKLLRFKADPNARCKDRRTALHLAVSGSRMPLVRDLVAIKADIHAYDAEGRTTIHWAAEGSSVEACAFLIGQKADVNAQTHRHRWSPLHYACRGKLQDDVCELQRSYIFSPRRSIYETDLPLAVLLIMNKADINAESAAAGNTEGAEDGKPLDLVQDIDHKEALRAIEAVVHAQGLQMARGCSTQYACAFWDNLCDASRFFRMVLHNGSRELSDVAIQNGIEHSVYPVATDKDMEVTAVVRGLVNAGADPELLLLSVVDNGGQIDEEFMLQCVDVLQGQYGAQGLVAPSSDQVCSALSVTRSLCECSSFAQVPVYILMPCLVCVVVVVVASVRVYSGVCLSIR